MLVWRQTLSPRGELLNYRSEGMEQLSQLSAKAKHPACRIREAGRQQRNREQFFLIKTQSSPAYRVAVLFNAAVHLRRANGTPAATRGIILRNMLSRHLQQLCWVARAIDIMPLPLHLAFIIALLDPTLSESDFLRLNRWGRSWSICPFRNNPEFSHP